MSTISIRNIYKWIYFYLFYNKFYCNMHFITKLFLSSYGFYHMSYKYLISNIKRHMTKKNNWIQF